MSNAFRDFILEQMDARHWRQADLVRASGLSRSHVSKLLKDDRPRLPQIPDQATLDGIARAFHLDDTEIRRVATRAVGVPDGPAPAIVYELRDATDQELLAELQKRLALRVVSDEEWEQVAEREKNNEIIGEIEHDSQPVYTTQSENPYPRKTVEHRRFEVERAEGIAMLEDLVSFFERHPQHAQGEPVDIVIGGSARTIIFAGDQVPTTDGERAARLGRSVGRAQRRVQDEEAVAPDVEGPEGGA